MKTHDSSTQPSLRRPETGAVLVVVLLAMIALLGMGLTGLYLTSGSIQMSANINMRNQALYVAEAGIQAAKNLLNQPLPVNLNSLLAGNSPLTLSPVALPSSISDEPLSDPLNGCLGRDASGFKRGAVLRDEPGLGCRPDTSAYADCNYPTTIAHDEAPPDPNTMRPAPTQYMGKYTIFIRQDLAECRQGPGHFTQDTNGIVVIRSEGTASDNRTKVVIEATMSHNPVATLLPPTIAQTCTAGAAGCDDNSSVQQGITVAGNNLTPPTGGTTGGGGTGGTGTGTGGGGGTGTGTGTGGGGGGGTTSTGGNTSGNTIGCTPPKILCSGSCVTPNTNPNCGTCGTSCTSDQACCASGSTWTCDNIKTDNSNCGTCSTKCATGQTTCCNGSCCASCCNNVCCASGTCCNNACCVAGNVCAVNGASSKCCSTATPSLCGTSCVNTTNDPNNCGLCGTTCHAGYLCCNSGCVNVQADSAHCGSCAKACSSKQGCLNGTCTDCLKYAVQANRSCITIDGGSKVTGSIGQSSPKYSGGHNPCPNNCPSGNNKDDSPCVTGNMDFNVSPTYTTTSFPAPACTRDLGSVTLQNSSNKTISAGCYDYLTIDSGSTLSLKGGNYVVTGLNLNGGGTLHIIANGTGGGPVKLWVSSAPSLSSTVTVSTGNPNDFWLIYNGTSGDLNNNSTDKFTGVIFAPGTNVNLDYDVTGAVIAASITLNGSSSVTLAAKYCLLY
jgi:hypothetical protein